MTSLTSLHMSKCAWSISITNDLPRHLTQWKVNHTYLHQTRAKSDTEMADPLSPRLPYEPDFGHASVPLSNIYEPVPKGFIRTVRILGFGARGLLRCRLQSQRFDRHPYAAISYTWNPDAGAWYHPPSKKDKPIRVNGKVVTVREKVVDILCLMQ